MGDVKKKKMQQVFIIIKVKTNYFPDTAINTQCLISGFTDRYF